MSSIIGSLSSFVEYSGCVTALQNMYYVPRRMFANGVTEFAISLVDNDAVQVVAQRVLPASWVEPTEDRITRVFGHVTQEAFKASIEIAMAEIVEAVAPEIEAEYKDQIAFFANSIAMAISRALFCADQTVHLEDAFHEYIATPIAKRTRRFPIRKAAGVGFDMLASGLTATAATTLAAPACAAAFGASSAICTPSATTVSIAKMAPTLGYAVPLGKVALSTTLAHENGKHFEKRLLSLLVKIAKRFPEQKEYVKRIYEDLKAYFAKEENPPTAEAQKGILAEVGALLAHPRVVSFRAKLQTRMEREARLAVKKEFGVTIMIGLDRIAMTTKGQFEERDATRPSPPPPPPAESSLATTSIQCATRLIVGEIANHLTSREEIDTAFDVMGHLITTDTLHTKLQSAVRTQLHKVPIVRAMLGFIYRLNRIITPLIEHAKSLSRIFDKQLPEDYRIGPKIEFIETYRDKIVNFENEFLSMKASDLFKNVADIIKALSEYASTLHTALRTYQEELFQIAENASNTITELMQEFARTGVKPPGLDAAREQLESAMKALAEYSELLNNSLTLSSELKQHKRGSEKESFETEGAGGSGEEPQPLEVPSPESTRAYEVFQERYAAILETVQGQMESIQETAEENSATVSQAFKEYVSELFAALSAIEIPLPKIPDFTAPLGALMNSWKFDPTAALSSFATTTTKYVGDAASLASSTASYVGSSASSMLKYLGGAASSLTPSLPKIDITGLSPANATLVRAIETAAQEECDDFDSTVESIQEHWNEKALALALKQPDMPRSRLVHLKKLVDEYLADGKKIDDPRRRSLQRAFTKLLKKDS